MTNHLYVRLAAGAPGDTVGVSAFVRDYTTAFPDSRLSVNSCRADEIFAHDDRVTRIPPQTTPITLRYRPTIDAARTDPNRRYMYAAHDSFETVTGVRLPRGSAKPSLILSRDERTPPRQQPYAVVAGGSKADIATKQSPPELFREVVAKTQHLNWVQVGRTDGVRIKDRQWLIPYTANLLGKTSVRELMRLIAHASVVLCHTSLPMLLAAAFDVPCIVVGGGRESPSLFTGLGVTYLDTLGQLDCCKLQACKALYPIQTHSEVPYPSGTVCSDPVQTENVWIGRCMTLYTADQIVSALSTSKRHPLSLAE